MHPLIRTLDDTQLTFPLVSLLFFLLIFFSYSYTVQASFHVCPNLLSLPVPLCSFLPWILLFWCSRLPLPAGGQLLSFYWPPQPPLFPAGRHYHPWFASIRSGCLYGIMRSDKNEGVGNQEETCDLNGEGCTTRLIEHRTTKQQVQE